MFETQRPRVGRSDHRQEPGYGVRCAAEQLERGARPIAVGRERPVAVPSVGRRVKVERYVFDVAVPFVSLPDARDLPVAGRSRTTVGRRPPVGYRCRAIRRRPTARCDGDQSDDDDNDERDPAHTGFRHFVTVPGYRGYHSCRDVTASLQRTFEKIPREKILRRDDIYLFFSFFFSFRFRCARETINKEPIRICFRDRVAKTNVPVQI